MGLGGAQKWAEGYGEDTNITPLWNRTLTVQLVARHYTEKYMQIVMNVLI
jgi:hypothetical protein